MRFLRVLKWTSYAALLGLVLTLTAVDTLGQGRGRGGQGGGGQGGGGFGGGQMQQYVIPGGQGMPQGMVFAQPGVPGQAIQLQGDPQQVRQQIQALGQQGLFNQQGGGGRGQGGRGGQGGFGGDQFGQGGGRGQGGRGGQGGFGGDQFGQGGGRGQGGRGGQGGFGGDQSGQFNQGSRGQGGFGGDQFGQGGGRGTQGGFGGQQGNFNQQGGGGGRGGGGRGNFDPSSLSDDQILMMMRRYDRDGDNRISMQEAESNNQIAPYFAAYQRGGYMGINEYKRFMTDRVTRSGAAAEIDARGGGGGGFGGGGGRSQGFGDQGNWGGGNQNNWGGSQNNNNWGSGNPDFYAANDSGGRNRRGRGVEEEEVKPVYRYGKLPVQLPSWWESLDEDKDGQIGFYEWRKANRDLDQYKEMDLNDDKLLTPDEYIKYNKQLWEHKPGEEPDGPPARIGATGRGGRGGGGGGPGGSYGGPNDRSNFGGTPGPNPFTNPGVGSPSGNSGGGNPRSGQERTFYYGPDGQQGEIQVTFGGNSRGAGGRGSGGGSPDGTAGGGNPNGGRGSGNPGGGRGAGGRVTGGGSPDGNVGSGTPGGGRGAGGPGGGGGGRGGRGGGGRGGEND